MKKKKIPYGISNFESIAFENYLFVDKTHFIEKLEELGAKYICYFRPRRFGKSLFISILSHYYDAFHREKFDRLFGHLYIGKNPTPLKNSYGILRFDFSGIETGEMERIRKGFNREILSAIQDFHVRYRILKEGEFEKWEGIEEPSALLKSFFGIVNERFNGKLYILIDEYDHFANELLAFDMKKFKAVMTGRGFVRKFYEVIKAGSTSIVDRVFITGVTPITLDSLTSGFNIDANLTHHLWFHDMMGFTSQEVASAIQNSASPLSEPLDELIKKLSALYNGYLFHEEGQERIYNPEMILYFLAHYAIFKKFPKKLLDVNIASDYGKLAMMLQIGDRERNFIMAQHIVESQEIISDLVESYDLEYREFGEEDMVSLLYYLGMLTIQGPHGGRIQFTIPNYVIKKMYFEYFLEQVFKKVRIAFKAAVQEIEDAVFEMAYHAKIEPFISCVENFFQKLSNRDFIKFDEKYVKLSFIQYLTMSNLYIVKSEVELGQGYCDIVLFKNPAIDPPYQFIFELKYLKKGDTTKEKIDKKIAEGKQQIEKYRRSEEGKKRTDFGYVILFAGEKCERIEAV